MFQNIHNLGLLQYKRLTNLQNGIQNCFKLVSLNCTMNNNSINSTPRLDVGKIKEWVDIPLLIFHLFIL